MTVCVSLSTLNRALIYCGFLTQKYFTPLSTDLPLSDTNMLTTAFLLHISISRPFNLPLPLFLSNLLPTFHFSSPHSFLSLSDPFPLHPHSLHISPFSSLTSQSDGRIGSVESIRRLRIQKRSTGMVTYLTAHAINGLRHPLSLRRSSYLTLHLLNYILAFCYIQPFAF